MKRDTWSGRRNALRYLLEAVLLSALAVTVLSPWGCSRSPVNPDLIPTHDTFTLPNGAVAHPGTALPQTEVSSTDPSAIPIYQDPLDTVSVEVGSYSDSIDVSGGVIDMTLDEEKSYFFVPTEAVSEKTVIRVTVYRREDAVDRRITEFHFGPEGLKFNVPPMLSYHTLLKDGEILELSWWDPEAEKWMRSAEAVVVAGYATFPIYHFSDYRTTERVSLGGQRGAK